MFSLRIVSSAKFLKMPHDSQTLYFHLGINADDDGVVEAFPIMRMTGSTEDNLKILAAKGFVRVLNEDLVSHIIDWREHNLIRADRKVDSIYKDLLLQVISEDELLEAKPRADTKKLTGIIVDAHWTADGPHRLGKDRLGKDRLGKDRLGKDIVDYENDTCLNFQLILNCWNNKQLPNHKAVTFKRNIMKKQKDIVIEYGIIEICQAISNYNIVVNSDDYYYSHKGNLWNFLSRYVDNFIDSADPLVNYKLTGVQKNINNGVEDNYELL